MTFAVAFDFSTKQERPIALEEANAARAEGHYCWIDLSAPATDELRQYLEGLGIGGAAIDEVVEFDPRPAFNIHPGCLHFSLAEGRLIDGDFQSVALQVVLGNGFMVTIHQHDSETLRRAMLTYSEGFRTVALSPGFLLFELADHLAQVFSLTFQTLEDRVEEMEGRLFGETDEDVFQPASELIRALLQFRKTVIGSREIIHQLANRRSPFVPETTQSYLQKEAVLLERLCADATTEREILSEFLNLYMGIISHRTNRVVTQLTVISSIFLPLAFLTGLYGMNFDTKSPWNMPELRHEFGYIGFWILAGMVIGGMLLWMRFRRWL